ncbi:hypothetical protein POTOM_029264 [Populus tomentosa]|uniref:RING-type E3 ubiquitin transferase n=1 Tax=Populus tomentosa TaxID=118781 RepID=A0A8X7Z6L4_POPTO|nr:hypothetical protein POTOM_029264 [Populus tomentosa]
MVLFSYPINPISTNGLKCASRQTLESGSLEHSQTYFRSEGPQVHTPISAPPHDVFPHCSAGGNFYPPPELNAAQVHSNQYNRHGIHEVEGGLLDQTMSTGRGPFNRKGPGVSTSRERGGTSGVYSAGSTSNSFELHHEKPTSDYRNNFDSSGLPPYMSSSLSIGGEDSPRNVRSRSRLDLEPNPRGTHLLSFSSHPFSSTSHLRNHPGPEDASNLNADITAYENPAAPPRYLHGFHAQASREGQNSYPRRAIPTCRTDISSSHFGQEATAIENGQHFLSETHNSRYPRPLSSGGWHSNHRERRPRISIERFQSFSNVVDAHDRIGSESCNFTCCNDENASSSLRGSHLVQNAKLWDASELLYDPCSLCSMQCVHISTKPEFGFCLIGALMMLDNPYLYGSINLFDQYRDMRLDVDSMSYKELLVLGERIGNVNTGLPEDVSVDKAGTIKNCGHADCIKKWLSMKNMCPICKAPAVADSSNEE